MFPSSENMKCPECGRDMEWVGSVLETDKKPFHQYYCPKCRIEVKKYIIK